VAAAVAVALAAVVAVAAAAVGVAVGSWARAAVDVIPSTPRANKIVSKTRVGAWWFMSLLWFGAHLVAMI
jgi:hypothetical protein